MASMRNWAKVAQSTGMNIAQFRACDEENCTFEKFVEGDVCNPKKAGGLKQMGHGASAQEHVYTDDADGACIYNLESNTHRDALADANAGLPVIDKYLNQQRGGEEGVIYLVHQAHTVRAFTCVDRAFVEGKAFVNSAEIGDDPVYDQTDCDANDHLVLYHSMPAMTASFAKAVARKVAMDGGSSSSSTSAGSSGVGPTE